VDRVKDRLEQLDQDDDDGEMLQLTQKEYQRHIERKRESLIQAWNGEKRVRALKIAIKVNYFLHVPLRHLNLSLHLLILYDSQLHLCLSFSLFVLFLIHIVCQASGEHI
jgi:hypothetical protein